MADYETEEQQLEALKRWWKENASSILIGLAVGGISLGSWNFYQKTQYQHSIEASDLYVSVIAQAEASVDSVFDSATVDKLTAGYADTPYAALSAMVEAKYEIDSGNIDKAIVRLQWVMANAVEDEIKSVAQLRLARLKITQKKYDEANVLLSVKHASAFDSMYEELKGDMFVAKGEVEQARIAYDKAISKSKNASRWLKLKRQDLGSSKLNQAEFSEPSA